MKERMDDQFSAVRGERALLISYATAYFPDTKGSRDIMLAMLESGSDILEIGIPFSGPVMDGPVIQGTSRRALEEGASVEGVLELAGEIRTATEKSLIFMGYYNPIYHYGLERFAAAARERGVDGVIIPDLPPEEAGPWKAAANENGIATVLFAAMNSSDERIKRAGELTDGFLYCVAVMGTTGMRDKISESLGSFLNRTAGLVDCPLATGLGISTPEQCKSVGEMAQGVIIGSAFMNTIIQGGGPKEIGEMVRRFSRALAAP